MLVLSRKRDETIMIGDDIEITVVDIRGEKVRIGVNAPPHVPVHRKEIYEAIKREKQGGSPESSAGRAEAISAAKTTVEVLSKVSGAIMAQDSKLLTRPNLGLKPKKRRRRRHQC